MFRTHGFIWLFELNRGPGEELLAFKAEMREGSPVVVVWAKFFRSRLRKPGCCVKNEGWRFDHKRKLGVRDKRAESTFEVQSRGG